MQLQQVLMLSFRIHLLWSHLWAQERLSCDDLFGGSVLLYMSCMLACDICRIAWSCCTYAWDFCAMAWKCCTLACNCCTIILCKWMNEFTSECTKHDNTDIQVISIYQTCTSEDGPLDVEVHNSTEQDHPWAVKKRNNEKNPQFLNSLAMVVWQSYKWKFMKLIKIT